jgi:hypothetical protein
MHYIRYTGKLKVVHADLKPSPGEAWVVKMALEDELANVPSIGGLVAYSFVIHCANIHTIGGLGTLNLCGSIHSSLSLSLSLSLSQKQGLI